MTLVELQKILGERITVALDSTMDGEQRERENETTEIITKVAKQMINNADVILRRDKLRMEGKMLQDSTINEVVG